MNSKALMRSFGALVMLMFITIFAQADVFNMPTEQTSLEFVTVGDPGNQPDMRHGLSTGSVSNVYAIGKYEITAGQYCQFLNAVAATDIYGLYNTNMWSNSYGCHIQRSGSQNHYQYNVTSEWINRPVDYVNFWDACRFCNWLQNGQPIGSEGSGTTETGTYTLNGYTGSDGHTISRNDGAVYFIPDNDEWHKAAFYKGGGINAGYWSYATQSDNPPIAESPPGHSELPGSANCFIDGVGWVDPVHGTTEVGSYVQSPGPYGTFDQAGNVYEMTETVLANGERLYQGGSLEEWPIPAWAGAYADPSRDGSNSGFRIASVPEPSSIISLLGLGVFGFITNVWRWHKTTY
jgi:formylglycine-generating enzyme required for sulfatase activity